MKIADQIMPDIKDQLKDQLKIFQSKPDIKDK